MADPQRTSPVVRPGIVTQQGNFEQRLRALERQYPVKYLEQGNDGEDETGWRLMLDGTGAVQPEGYSIFWAVWLFPFGATPWNPPLNLAGGGTTVGLAVGTLTVSCLNAFWAQGTLGAGGTGYFLEPATLAADRIIDLFPSALSGYYQDFSASTATFAAWQQSFFATPPGAFRLGFMGAGGVNFTPTVPISWDDIDTMFNGQFVGQYTYASD